MDLSAQQVDIGNHAGRRLLLQSSEARGSELSTSDGIAKKANICVTAKLTRKRVVEDKGK